MKRLSIIIAASLVVSTAFAQPKGNFPLTPRNPQKSNGWSGLKMSLSKAKTAQIKKLSPEIERAIEPADIRDPGSMTPRRCAIVPDVSKITTIAGNGTYGFSGDGGQATSAGLASPEGVAIDVYGNLYIADAGNNRIRRVDRETHLITTVAGKGTPGLSGDRGPATLAELRFPTGVDIYADGNLYIADLSNIRVRKVDTSGIITTVAGDGTGGYSEDEDGGRLATSASLSKPRDVTVDASGNLYISETRDYKLLRVDTSGIITTVAGKGTPEFSGDGGPATSAGLNPLDVAVDADRNLYIADAYNRRIRKVDTSGNITTVAGNGIPGFTGDGGQATSAGLAFPTGIAIDADRNLYIADSADHRIRKVDHLTGIITTVAGNGAPGYSEDEDGGPATSASLSKPHRIAIDRDGNLYIADGDNNRVRKVTVTCED